MNTELSTYYALSTDPLHIGAGGYRLGRVDNTIVREPGTDLPKVPGSSISGVCRNYSIYSLEDEAEQKMAMEGCAARMDEKDNTKPAKDQGNCGKCAICKTFGFASPDNSTGNQIGRVKFFDGRILAFPVRTMVGPVWVSTASILTEAGVTEVEAPDDNTVFINFDLAGVKTNEDSTNRLNLGWLYLNAKKKSVNFPEALIKSNNKFIHTISKRLVLVPDWLFPEIVNNNLETRTSVAIDFKTGAAKNGALFTYEAIPRATLLSFDVVIDHHRCSSEWSAEKVTGIVKGGLRLFGVLGAGGMNTRGFGRMQIVNLD